MNTYQPGSATSGNPTNVYNMGLVLKAVNVVEVLDRVVKTISVPMNKNETVNMMRAVTPEPRLTEVAEGVNPAPRALTYENVTATFEEFAETFAVSSRQAELGEQNVLVDSRDRLVDLMKRTREKNAWFEYRSGTLRIFNTGAISLRSGVNGPITLGRLRTAVRTLNNNRAPYITAIAKGSLNVGTVPTEAAYICLAHTDCRADIRRIPGFVPQPAMGGSRVNLPGVFGQVDDVIFITSPEFEPFFGEGAAVGATNMRSAGGTNVDVYSYVLFGAEALGKCNLQGRGNGGLGAVEMNVLDRADKSDPTNQRRLVSCRWWDNPVILQQLHVVRIEAGATENIE